MQYSGLILSLAVLDPRVGHTMDVGAYSLHLSLSSVILTDSSVESPDHVLMLYYFDQLSTVLAELCFSCVR